MTANFIQKVSFPLEHHFAFRGTTFSRDLPSFFDARILGKGIFRVYRQFLEADSSTAIVRLREPDSFMIAEMLSVNSYSSAYLDFN